MDMFKNNDFSKQATNRLIALWALNEAALGGVLLAFKIPFTGLFIGSGAVIIISLIAYFNNKPGTILRAAVIVMIIKGLVSPHTPITSYAAVMLQALIGEVVFRYFSWKIAAFLLAVLALLLSALQKFLIITLIFGMNIWESIDLFGNYILKLFTIVHQNTLGLPISFMLIILYCVIHLLAGLFVGIFLPRLAQKIKLEAGNKDLHITNIENLSNNSSQPPKKRRRFFKKINVYLVFTIALAIMLMSYIFPVFEESRGFASIIMVLRSILIMSSWYFIFGPFAIKRLKKFLSNKEHTYSSDINNILDLFPLLKKIVRNCWKESANRNKLKRPAIFILYLLVNIIYADFSQIA